MSKPNVLFLLIDGLRADKFYGNQKSSKTPNIDSLIKNSTYFTQAVSSADGTFLSLNSIFNSVYSFKTGTRAKKIILTDNNLFQNLKNFNYYIYGLIPDLISLHPLTEFFENNDAKYNGTPPVEHLSDGLGNKIINMLENKKMSEPWFYYVHILDLHHPQIIPDQYNDQKFGDSSYEQVISSIDFWIGKILNKIDLKRTSLIITADHGMTVPVENKTITDFEPDLALGLKIGKHIMPKPIHRFGAKLFILLRGIIRDIKLAKANRNLSSYEKRSRLPYFTLSLFDESIRIPLLIADNDIPSKIISQQVRSIDIFPTIAEMINMPTNKNPIHGTSLIPLIQGKTIPELPVYLHTMPYEKISPDDKVGIRTSKYKYFRSAHNQKQNVNLYNVSLDPLENNNLANSDNVVVNEMEKILSDITSKKTESSDKDADDEEIKKIQEELKKLGYL